MKNNNTNMTAREKARVISLQIMKTKQASIDLGIPSSNNKGKEMVLDPIAEHE
jgi:hypothetical protein